MSNKQKLLDALGCTIEDVNEDRLVDILLDAYAASQKRISELMAENAQERLHLRADQQALIDDRRRMREDPTCWVQGFYHFLGQGSRRIFVHVDGPRVKVYERAQNIDYLAQPLSPAEFDRVLP